MALVKRPASKRRPNRQAPENNPTKNSLGFDFDRTDTKDGARIKIKEGSTFIPDFAFVADSDIIYVEIPKTVEHIGEKAFGGCTRLSNVFFAKKSKLKTIGRSAFESCVDLPRIEIPKTVTLLLKKTFAGCRSLEHVGMRDGMLIEDKCHIFPDNPTLKKCILGKIQQQGGSIC